MEFSRQPGAIWVVCIFLSVVAWLSGYVDNIASWPALSSAALVDGDSSQRLDSARQPQLRGEGVHPGVPEEADLVVAVKPPTEVSAVSTEPPADTLEETSAADVDVDVDEVEASDEKRKGKKNKKPAGETSKHFWVMNETRQVQQGVDVETRGRCHRDAAAAWPGNGTLPLRLEVTQVPAGTKLQTSLPETSVKCAGSQQETRICNFKNVCVDLRKEAFLWNSGQQKPPPAPDQMCSMTGLPGTKTADGNFHFVEVLPERTVEAAATVATVRGVTAFLAERTGPWNAGHMVMNTALPIERLADEAGCCGPESRLVIFSDSCVRKQRNNQKHPRTKRCRKFTEQFVSAVTAYPILTLPHLKDGQGALLAGQDVSKVDFLCFEDAIAGIGRIFAYPEMSKWISAYREKLFLKSGFSPPPKSRGCNVVFTYKKGSGMHGLHPIENADEVATFTKEWAEQRGATYHGFDLGEVEFLDQLQMLGNASIHLSVAGSNAFASYNLGPGSELVYLSRSFETNVLVYSAEVRLTYISRAGQRAPLETLKYHLDRIAAERGCTVLH